MKNSLLIWSCAFSGMGIKKYEDPEKCIEMWNQRESFLLDRGIKLKLLVLFGQTLCLAEWSEKTNIKYSTLLYRLNRGWSFTKAITTPKIH